MDWMQVLVMLITMTGLFAWNRAEGRADNRHMDAKFTALLTAIHEEMKDFHGRLCAIEERYRSGNSPSKPSKKGE